MRPSTGIPKNITPENQIRGPVRVQTHIGSDAPSDRTVTGEMARFSQPVHAGEQKGGDPRCKQSVTAADLQEHPRTARDFRKAACANPADRPLGDDVHECSAAIRPELLHDSVPQRRAVGNGNPGSMRRRLTCAARTKYRHPAPQSLAGGTAANRSALRSPRRKSRLYGRSQSADTACQEIAMSQRRLGAVASRQALSNF